MKPTIGRIVHYVRAYSITTQTPYMIPAIIFAVNDDTCVNLVIFDDAGATPVYNVRFDIDGNNVHTWHWPVLQ